MYLTQGNHDKYGALRQGSGAIIALRAVARGMTFLESDSLRSLDGSPSRRWFWR